MRCPSTPTLALTVGALGSGAAQVAWNWPLGPVHVVAGIFATALVPIGLHLWPRVPITGRWTRAIRALVMTYISLAAAGVNLVHATWLLTDFEPVTELRVEGTITRIDHAATMNTVLAVLLITAVEAFMVMASLARRAPADAGVKRRQVAPRKTVAPPVPAYVAGLRVTERPPVPLADLPVPPPVAPPEADQDDLARARQLVAKARQEGRRYGRGQLADDLGVKPHVAKDLLARLRQESGVHLVETA